MNASARRIAQVVESTGLSRELIHHYLRQGLLPAPPSRARYTETQVRLLQLIRRLREDHGLPLEVIRSFFTLYDFDPARLEPLILAESLGHRLTRYALRNELSPSRTLSAEDLASEAGVSEERLAQYLEIGLARPLAASDDEDRYSVFDANIIALCERGVALGIPFDSFRTIASYIRVAFQLEHAEVFGGSWSGRSELSEVMSQLFLRREIVVNFVQNVLQALIQRHVHRSLEESDAPGTSLESVVYSPSEAFLRRHGLPGRIAALQEQLGPWARGWLELAELQLHAGRHREAAFSLEQALERWPDRLDLDALYGVALALSGQADEAVERLERAAERGALAPLCQVYLALLELLGGGDGGRVLGLTQQALDGADALGEARAGWGLTVRILGGWLLAALPPAFRRSTRGEALLVDAVTELSGAAGELDGVPGLRERLVINAAFLLDDRLRAAGQGAAGGLSRAALCDQVCRLDPGSAFAERAFLER